MGIAFEAGQECRASFGPSILHADVALGTLPTHLAIYNGGETQQSMERQRGVASSERRLKPEIGISAYRCSGAPSLLTPSFTIRSSSSVVIKTGGYSPIMNAALSRVTVSLSSKSIRYILPRGRACSNVTFPFQFSSPDARACLAASLA